MRDERMVEIGRLRQAEQDLQQPLDRGRGPQVGAANDQSSRRSRHRRRRRTDDSPRAHPSGRGWRRRVARSLDRNALHRPRVHDGQASDRQRLARNRAASSAASWRARSGSSGRPRQVPGYDVAGIAVRRGQRLGDVGAGAEAGVDQALRRSARRAPRHRLRSAATGPAPARPIRGRASAGPRKCRRRTRAGCGPGRDPRSAAGTAAAFAARGMAEHGADRHGRGAAGRSATARSASRSLRTVAERTLDARIRANAVIHRMSRRVGIRRSTREDGPDAPSPP